MDVDNEFASEFGHVPDLTQKDMTNATLFPTLDSELSMLGDQPLTQPVCEDISRITITSPITATASPTDIAYTETSLPVYGPHPKRPDPPTFEKQGDAVRQEKCKFTPKNTKLAYKSKAKEFQGYLKSVYGGTGDEDTCLTITPSKVFGFMYYQCYRAKRTTNSSPGTFDRADYDSVINQSSDSSEPQVDLLQTDSIQHYLGAIRNLLDDQIRSGITETRKEDLMTKNLKDLIDLVKTRRERVLKAMSKERIDGEFQPFLMMKQIPKIEKSLWEIKKNTCIRSQCFEE